MVTLFSTFRRLLFGECGPADIAVIRSGQGTHFRLPNEDAGGAHSSIIVIVVALGAYGIFLVINGTWQFPEEQRDYLGMGLSVAGIAAFLVFFFFRLRTNWHYEIFLTRAELRVIYVASGRRWQTARIDLAAVRQFTVRRDGSKSTLQAESIDDAHRFVLRSGRHELLLRLSELLTQERASLFLPRQPAPDR